MGRLFWKIFGWFWLAMVLVAVGVGVGVAPFSEQDDRLMKRDMLRMMVARHQAKIAATLRSKGLAEARAVARSIEEKSPIRLKIVELETDPAERRAPISVTQQQLRSHRVTLKDGRRYEIQAAPKPGMALLRFLSHTLRIPLPLLARTPELFSVKIGIAILISGLVCFWLAWYITRPVARLGEATRRLAAGDLSSRVEVGPTRRRDEIMDLGQGFNQMAERLQALISAQQRLLNDVSHELRSPLARLQVAVALTRRNADDKLTRTLDRVERESERLDRLVGQLLTLSRLEAGVVDPMEEDVVLTELLEELVQDADFEAQAASRGVTLKTNSAFQVRGSRELLRRALENVIRNGVKYTAEGTSVEVCAVPSGADAEIVIEIRDRGPGMAESHLTQVFEPFVRLPDEPGSNRTGYGLGLAIARRVIEAHGGRVAAHNIAEGGLCVSAFLPAAGAPALLPVRAGSDG